VGKSEERRPLGRNRRRWEDDIKIDVKEMGGSCECGNEPPGSIKCGEFHIVVVELEELKV
jgi:hypothetical protein